MGVESDRLVFDYLSRVGDLAQTAMPAAQRMQLVARLRNDIDSRRGSADNPAAVRRILGSIGTPDEVVEAAAGGGSSRADGPQVPSAGPDRGSGGAPGAYGPYAKDVPGPRGGSGEATGGSGFKGGAWEAEEPEWWRVDRHGGALHAGDELVGLPGMTGGVFISFEDDDLPEGKGAQDAQAATGDREQAQQADHGDGAGGRRRMPALAGLRRLGTGWGSPLLLIAAALLLGGAAAGSLIPLGLGWATAYLSRGLTRTQAKFAVLGIPGCAAAALVVWVWGRDTGHWGSPIAQGQIGHVFRDDYPLAVRLAAVATAVYLLRRARRSA